MATKPERKTIKLHYVYPLILAALSNTKSSSSRTLLKKCLKKLHLSLLARNSQFSNPSCLLSVLPILLRSTFPEIASLSAEIVGAASLSSFEMNEVIAYDAAIIESLMSALSCRSKSVSVAACNAVLDLSTTSIGRQLLCEFSAMEKLMFEFLPVADCLTRTISLHSTEKGNSNHARIGFMIDGLPVLLLDASITLINSCDMLQLEMIPVKLSETFVSHLKRMWVKVRNQMLWGSDAGGSQGRYYYSNVKLHDLAESIFRLCLDPGQHSTTCSLEMIKRNIFGPTNSYFEHFVLNYWEDSPFLLRGPSNGLNDHGDFVSFFYEYLSSKGSVDSILLSMLRTFVSCPPIASEELDILSFLKEVKDGLGCPMEYGQDVRVLKTVDVTSNPRQGHLKREVHFFGDTPDSSVKDSHFIDSCSVQKCMEACKQGYTIALRGMEFRSEKIATISDGLAVLFGQPSVGANLYLTPPRSQGLARHYDDHCVFVCQLLGVKLWTVFSRAAVLLPRLYDPLDNLPGAVDDSNTSQYKQFLLREGDILYIPRGCPHEACTIADDGEPPGNDCSTGYSLHLTLGVEVEPPFEWEGFAHVALHCWNQNQQTAPLTIDDISLDVLHVMSVKLLHIAIRLLGDRDPTFRKACMVTAFSLPSNTTGKSWFHTPDLNQRTTFSYVINTIEKESKFFEVFKSIEAVVQKNEDPFHQMRWIEHLCQDGVTKEQDSSRSSSKYKDFLLLCNEHGEEAEVAFTQVKSKFCRDIEYNDACENFRTLLEKYRKTRKQYMNGMLSLHCN
ncbi:hypothetical protein NE237_026190 [Protea cynaroides]|uniref:Bifunctional lysine-specific demethylase and histidyl-hydroxylase n=1 Tax=Protea cynaroides TaxID=273540 RepID=A0A9Q0H8F7_9MAGN|nr:hypothetical protein NE237_026190 [Protea cynaroides]